MQATIYIPTYKRIGRQETWSWLPADVQRDHAFLVAVPEEAEALEMLGYNVLSCPAQGIAATRQWIMDNHDLARGNVAIMMDDDLKFSVRRQDEPTKFVKPAKGSPEVQEMLDLMEGLMDFVPFGGLAARSGANRVTEPYRMNARIYDSWVVNVKVARALNIRVDRVPFMEDFDTALQFLHYGFPNLMLNTHVKDDNGSNVSGGCSAYRDDTGQELAAMQLKGLWPDFVTLVQRPAWNGMDGSRTDVRIGWAKAYKQGLDNRDLMGVPPEPEFHWGEGVLQAS